ncbi:MAG TPA: hypothetical protein VGE74_19465 [Gemmata sp.]
MPRNILQRAAGVFADEGFAGLVRRFGRKLAGPRTPEAPVTAAPPVDPPDAALARAKSEYAHQEAAFRARAGAGVDDYYWYHTVDLGNGLVTPGDYDFRDQVSAFGSPADMTGMRVLDVGSATGFFAFEFERRGAQVTSVELPSLAAWDMVGAERADVLRRLQVAHRAATPEEAYTKHLDGPFRFCHERLRSRVARCYSSVYDLTRAKLGGEPFDLVYAGDILMHLFSPFLALDVLSGLTRGSLFLTIEVPFPGPADQAWIAFRGHLSDDGRTWWMPSRECATQMLHRLGFGSVAVAGSYSGIARRAWFPYAREVLRAERV